MEIGKGFKGILSVLVFMSLFCICIPILCAEAKTDITAHIAPADNGQTDSDDNTKTESLKDKKTVGTGDNLFRLCLLIMSAALSMSFTVILFLRYRKTRD